MISVSNDYFISKGKDCGQIQPPQNGSVIENNGQIIKFVCDPGYELHGDAQATCLQTGNWSVKVPQCQRK